MKLKNGVTPDGFEGMDADTFRVAGLLYMVNKTVLWPLGLALRVTYWDDISENGLDVVMLTESETITEGAINIDREPGRCHPSQRFTRFAQDRIASMPTEMEREMALKALRKIVPGVDISPLRSDPEGVPSRDQVGTQEGS
jgi:hypothetical protein